VNWGKDVAVVIPLWRRTKNIDRVTCSLLDTVPLAHICFVVSSGDEWITPWTTLPGDTIVVDGVGGEPGDYARKINAGYRATEEPFIFTGADDLVFHDGWYDAARALIVCPYGDETCPCQDGDLCHYEGDDPMPPPRPPEPRIGVVGTVDRCNGRTMAGEHSTHSLVARWYADCCAVGDQPGAIYCEQYAHEYCDDELVQTALFRGAYAHAHDAIVEHVHMLVHPELDDEVYQHGRSRTRLSRRTFLQRQRLWGKGGAWPYQR
jgi:hypothetical protein